MDLDTIRTNALRAVNPLKSADVDFYGGHRTDAGRNLPEYYFVYFLLVDLLSFKCLGREEKVAWSIPVQLDGLLFHVEYRKMGLGVFSSRGEESEAAAEEVVRRIDRGVRAARRYFDWRAEDAVKNSQVNVVNRSIELQSRFEFLLQASKTKLVEFEADRRKAKVATRETGNIGIRFPDYQLARQADWFALSATESFFSWTEHVFILLAIMTGDCVTGESVNILAAADWKDKFQAVFNIDDPEIKRHYDALTTIRVQVRNFVAHGSFGKKGQAFKFHSGAGAVPVLLPHREGYHSYRFLGNGNGIDESQAISSIEQFIEFIRTGPLEPAWMFLDNGMDLVLTNAKTGYYKSAMASMDAMSELVEIETRIADAYADMDWWLAP